MSIEREIDKLRQQLMDEQPFWGILASRLKTVVGNHFHGREVKTAAVDGRHLFINPDFWNDLSLKKGKPSLFTRLPTLASDTTFAGTTEIRKYGTWQEITRST